MNRRSSTPCGQPLGERLRIRDGQWFTEPYSCGKPARVKGPDGVVRCVQHDRMARGLSGKWPRKP